ncbi:MAG TPA: hypothetical protein VKH45_00840 [Candidatus Acidoferrum sp.]|nr:hypothetical protein [Candidatus Acidoferrum sp.]
MKTTDADLVQRLGRSNLYTDFKQAFGASTGLPMALRPLAFWQLAHSSWPHENPFWAVIAQTNRGCAACFRTHGLMAIEKLFLGLLAISVCGSQVSEAQTLVTRVYNGKEFEGYSLDPPFWTYHSKGYRHSKSAHWVYRSHRYVFIDIRMNFTDLR